MPIGTEEVASAGGVQPWSPISWAYQGFNQLNRMTGTDTADPTDVAAREFQTARSQAEYQLRKEWAKDKYPDWDNMSEQERYAHRDEIMGADPEQMAADLGVQMPSIMTMEQPFEWGPEGATWDPEVWGQVESGTTNPNDWDLSDITGITGGGFGGEGGGVGGGGNMASGGSNWWEDSLSKGIDWLGNNWQDVVGVAAPIAGAYIGAEAGRDAAAIEAGAMLEQAGMQDRLARDLTATGIDYATEQRDISLIGSEPYRNAGALAMAGMMDMTGLDRGLMPGAPGSSEASGMAPPPGSQVGVGEAIGGEGTGGAGGTSMYDPETSYDLDRLWDPTRIISEAPQYDFKTDPSYQFRLDEGQRALERSFNAGGATKSGAYDLALMEHGQGMASQEFGNIYNRLANIAGFAPLGGAQGGQPGAATQFGGAQIEALGGIGAAGSARGQGQIAAGNAWSNAFNQIGQWAGYRGGNQQQQQQPQQSSFGPYEGAYQF